MAYPIVTGTILIEANGAALNMAGQEEGGRTGNVIVVKQIRVGRNRYPYISGQAWRRWLREVLYQDYGWKRSPVIRERKSAYTEGDPIQYEEDDLFGYMAAKKRGEQGGTQRRISPLKNSLLISVIPNAIVEDFGHFSRNLQPGEDIIPFEHQHYTSLLQGTFTISLQDVGRFEVGEMRDLSEEMMERYKDKIGQGEDGFYLLSQDERARRAKEVLRALARLRYGAQLARNLSDVSPVAVIIGFLDGGNAPFQNLFRPTPEGERVELNIERFTSVIQDYMDRFLERKLNGRGPEKFPILMGWRPTVLANEEAVGEALDQEPLKDVIRWKEDDGSILTPREVLERAAGLVEEAFAGLMKPERP
ncbi:TPA: type I-B CRISPR-associated protein Cas7/Cst2/DevR [Candidatus Bipolaricaulota bacterium]|nr:type I-B CRISPR-associated protein Cas7/Cst2/DevR [Candidatus Bipolaricaulota bacterium]